MARHGGAGLAVALGLMAGGWLAAHALAYALAAPHAHERGQLLQETGHGWLDARALVMLSATVVLVGLVATAVAAARGTASGAPPARLLAALPVGGATGQEIAERLLAGVPADRLVDVALALVVLLQAPAALAALLLARLLLREAAALVRGLRGVLPPARRSRPSTWIHLPAPRGSSRPALALGHGERGPPGPPAVR